MKGIVLAAGKGTRLQPMTQYVSKLLLPIYDAPMITYSLGILYRLGIETTMIVLDKEHNEQVKEYLGDTFHGMSLSYGLQEQPLGTADALKVAKEYAGEDNIAVILGDQYLTDLPVIARFNQGAMCYYQQVKDTSKFGTITTTMDGKVTSIIEKPSGKNPGMALVGFYLFDKQVWEHLSGVQKSSRGEYELTDVLRSYSLSNNLEARKLKGVWTDAGTPETLYLASSLRREKYQAFANNVEQYF